ncbi:MAG TPA: sulfite exporter TauE/SafE family protein [Casimicrobiaceae bacterium]|nr:sulfite exporter TauE/SafE family protein [Casimicrobiaceae bacterium]
MAATLLLSALLAGLVGGLHCAAMCGGFVAAIAARDPQPLRPLRSLVARQLHYHGGRVASYMLLGAAFGAVGAATVDAIDLVPVQKGLYVAANVLLLLLAMTVATRTSGMSWLTAAGMGAFGRVLPLVRPLAGGGGAGSRLALGALWGFVPCSLVYGVLPLALFAGGAWQGALVMLVFGLGTLPHLAGAGYLLARARERLRGNVFRHAAAALIAAFALAGIYRALYVPGSLGQGPFCLLP